jgi:hypothetical protein
MRMIKVRSAGPLISKLRKRELARKRSRVSSMMSYSEGSPGGGSRSARARGAGGHPRTDGSRAPDACSEGQDSEVADLASIGRFVEGGMVGLCVSVSCGGLAGAETYWHRATVDGRAVWRCLAAAWSVAING